MASETAIDGGGGDESLDVPTALMNAGIQALQRQDFDTAEHAFGQALLAAEEDHPDTVVDLYKQLARVCALTGRSQQSADLERAADLLELRRAKLLASPENMRRLIEALRPFPDRRAELGDLLEYLALRERFTIESLAAAREHMEEAVRIADELDPGSLATAIRRGNLVAILGAQRDLPAALELAELIRDKLTAEDPVAASVLLRSTAQFRLLTGDLPGAEADAREAIRLAKGKDAAPVRAAALSALGMIRAEQGDGKEAIALYRKALAEPDAAGEGLQAVPMGVNLVRLGDLERGRGNLDTSAEYLSQAVALLQENAPGSVELVEAQRKLGETRFQMGESGQAISALRAAKQLARDPATRLQHSVGLAEAYKALGRFADARTVLEDALADAASVHDPRLLAHASMSLAGAHRWLGDLEQAQRMYEAVLSQAPAESSVQSQAMSNLGGIFYDRREYDAAINLYRQALELADGQEAVLTVSYNLATSLHRAGRLAEADRLYARVLAELPGVSRRHSSAASGRGVIAYARGRLGRAIRFLRQAVDIDERLLAAAGDANRQSLVRLLYQHYGDLLTVLLQRGRPEDVESGLLIAEMSRARMLESRLIASAALAPSATAAREQRLRYKLAVTARRLLKARNEPGSRQAAVAELQRQERELSAALADLDQDGPATAGLTVLDAPAIQEALQESDVLLEYVTANERVYVFAVTRRAVEAHLLQASVSDLTASVVEIIAPYHVDFSLAEDSAANWDGLRGTVLGPVAHLLTGARRLFVSPDGPLHYISFEPLTEGLTVVYVPSATIGFRPRKPRPARQAETDFVGLGNPAFDSSLQEFAGLLPLPGAEVEVEEIRELFGDRGVALTGPAATEAALRYWARRCRYLHVAAHGLVDRDNPMRSGIVLAEPQVLRIDEQSGSDDVLYGYEMIDLDIAAELVVFAACRTGFGVPQAGEGLSSMGSALLQAGAAWVLVSLWPVGDLVSAAFMRFLYEAIISGAPVPDAVQSAREEIRADHSDPYWWAGFVLFGARA